MKYYRVSVSLFGYATVQGENKEEAFENIKKLTKGDLDLEDLTEEVLEDATILEECTADGGAIDRGEGGICYGRECPLDDLPLVWRRTGP